MREPSFMVNIYGTYGIDFLSNYTVNPKFFFSISAAPEVLLKDSQTLAADLFSLGLTIYYSISGGKQLFSYERRYGANRFLERHQVVHEGCLDIQNGQLDAFNELHADGDFFTFLIL